MNIKKPTHFMGTPIKGAMKRALAEAERNNEATTSEPANFNTDIAKSDYIQIPNQSFLTAIAETDKNLNYFEAHKQVINQGAMIPDAYQFMSFYNHIIDCYKNNNPVFDAEGNPITEETKNDLYRQLTSDCWTWLNGVFHITDDKKTIEKVIGLDSQDNLLTKEEKLEDCLMHDCYIDFTKLTKQGLPSLNSKHSNQNYSKGENIYFWKPEIDDNFVSMFVANSNRVYLDCDGAPSYRGLGLGVRKVLIDAGREMGK